MHDAPPLPAARGERRWRGAPPKIKRSAAQPLVSCTLVECPRFQSAQLQQRQDPHETR